MSSLLFGSVISNGFEKRRENRFGVFRPEGYAIFFGFEI